MPYPPPVPPSTRTNSTPSVENHPADHNAISVALTEILNHIALMEQTFDPVGSIKIWPGDVAPTNWALCQGQEVSRTGATAGLFALIGTRYGAGNGSTTFNLPSFMGRAPFGVWAGGSVVTSFAYGGNKDLIVPVHAHSFNVNSGTISADHAHNVNFNTSDVSAHHDHITTVGVFFHDPFAPGFGITINQGSTLPANYGQVPVTMGGNHVHAAVGSTSGVTANHVHNVAGNTANAGGDTTNANMPPWTAVNFIIRVQ
jgi:microcystin-dependent protein